MLTLLAIHIVAAARGFRCGLDDATQASRHRGGERHRSRRGIIGNHVQYTAGPQTLRLPQCMAGKELGDDMFDSECNLKEMQDMYSSNVNNWPAAKIKVTWVRTASPNVPTITESDIQDNMDRLAAVFGGQGISFDWDVADIVVPDLSALDVLEALSLVRATLDPADNPFARPIYVVIDAFAQSLQIGGLCFPARDYDVRGTSRILEQPLTGLGGLMFMDAGHLLFQPDPLANIDSHGGTIVHEMGHCLGLLHIHAGDEQMFGSTSASSFWPDSCATFLNAYENAGCGLTNSPGTDPAFTVRGAQNCSWSGLMRAIRVIRSRTHPERPTSATYKANFPTSAPWTTPPALVPGRLSSPLSVAVALKARKWTWKKQVQTSCRMRRRCKLARLPHRRGDSSATTAAGTSFPKANSAESGVLSTASSAHLELGSSLWLELLWVLYQSP